MMIPLTTRPARMGVAVLCLAITTLLVVPGQIPLRAATFIVNDPVDRVDAIPGDGVCRTSAGTCSLRAAIQEANATSAADVIQLPAGTFTIAREPLNENDITVGDLDITAPLTISGAPGRTSIIDGGRAPFGAPPEQTALDRLFEIHPTAGNVTFSSLTIQEGWSAEDGGAIASLSRGTVRLIDVTLRGSVATGNGGAVYVDGNEGGSLVVERSTVADNSSGAAGGGLYITRGQLTVNGTAEAGVTISGNFAAGSGGGIHNAGDRNLAGQQSRATINFATITGNRSGAGGGGVANELDGILVLTDVNVSNNVAVGGGGGAAFGATASITGGTFTGNLAGGAGGAVASASSGAVVIDQLVCAGNGAGGIRPGTDVIFGPDGPVIVDPTRDTPILPDGTLIEPADEGGGCLSADGPGTLTVSGSTFEGNLGVGDGGALAIHSFGAARIADSLIRDNTTYRNGGGAHNSGMRVTFERLTLRSNTASLDGGGIQNESSGEFALLDTSVLSNVASSGGGMNIASDSTTRVSGSTFWDNRATCQSAENGDNQCGFGGGLLHSSDGAAEIENTTISTNIAQRAGGGVQVDADAGLHFVNVTITLNSAPSGSGVGIPTADVLLFPWPQPSPGAKFRNTIVAGNVGSPDCAVPFTTEGGNHDGTAHCGFIGVRDRQNVLRPNLLAIADNGGATMTHSLAISSVAVDGGVAPCLRVDQRGVTRPQYATCDVGAYEYNGPAPISDTTPPDTIIVDAPALTSEFGVFRFQGIDTQTLADEFLFECRINNVDPLEPPEPIDPTAPPPTTPDPLLGWVSCSNPWILDNSHLTPGASPYQMPEGQNQLLVRAIDRAGNVDPTPATHSWTDGVDTVAPETTLLSGPPPMTTSRNATFSFTGTDNLTPTERLEWECRLDGQPWDQLGECTNPALFSNLSLGEHTFEVRALDLGDNWDLTPARHTWRILPPATCEDANVNLPAVADTWIDEFEVSLNHGIDLGLQVRSEAMGQNARALVQFELPTDLPQCALSSATLRLYAQSGSADRALKAVPVAGPWQEMAVTWANQPPVASVGPRDDAGEPSNAGGSWQEWDVTAFVAAMLSGGMPNYGFMIRDTVESAENGGEQTFSSKDTVADSPQTPQLALRFAPVDPAAATPPPPPPPVPTVPTTVQCGQTLFESTLVGNSLFDCPGEGLIAGASNIMIDLGGHSIDGLNYLPPDPTQPLSPGAWLAGQEEGLPAGIRVSGMSNVVITNGTVQEFGVGVHLTPGTTYTVMEYLTLARNAIAGVALTDADNGTVGNTIRDNYLTQNGDGVLIALDSENSTIYRNRFETNYGVGLQLDDARGHRIEANRISGWQPNPQLSGSDGGLRLEGATDNLVLGNTIYWTGDAGVYLTQGSHRNRIEGNASSHAGDAGILIQNSNDNEVINNIAHISSDAGISLADANNTVVRGNDVRWNPSGISVSGGSNNLVQSNDTSEAEQTGIELAGPHSVTVVSNLASLTSGDGIAIEGDALDAAGNPIPGVLLQGNTANQNAKDGITVLGVGHTITANDAHNNVTAGIDAEGSIDGGGNRASGNNFGLEQCVGVACDSSMAVALVPPDTGRPDTIITVAPPDGASTLLRQVFEFTGSDNHAPLTALTFECRLDAAPDPPAPPQDPAEPPSAPPSEGWLTCASPMVFAGLSTGTHTFQVRAKDPAHNFDWEPATYSWTVAAAGPAASDTTPPETAIVSAPGDGTSTSASIAFNGVDDITPGFNLRFECALDGGAFTACASPVTYGALPLGLHTFQVRAFDTMGHVDSTPASHSWTILAAPPDVTAPETTITARPDPVTVATTASFSFTANEEGAMFLCALDGGAPTLCASPYTISDLVPGNHTLAVRAIDAAGNLDPTPATAAWQVGAPPVQRTVVCGEVLVQSTVLRNDLIDCPDYGLVIGADGITLDLNGFTIDGRGSLGAGILTQGHDFVTVTNGTVQEFDFGVRLTPGSANNIISSLRLIANTTAGIELSDADDGVSGNEIRNNVLVGNDTGIAVLNGTRNALVRGNVIGNSAENGILVGLLSTGSVIDGNEINVSSEHAILLEGVSHNTVTGNILHGNAEYAIAVESAADAVDPLIVHPANANRIDGNIVLGGYGGISVLGEAGSLPAPAEDNQITNNSVYETGGPGISLETAVGTLVRGNDVRYNAVGIQVSASADNWIEANQAVDSTGAGISIGESSVGNVVVLNTADSNATAGIEVGDPAAGNGNLIERNSAVANGGDGIYVPGTGHRITANSADHNVKWGIWVEMGNIDGGGNNAAGNDGGSLDPATGLLLQCYNIDCSNSPIGDAAAPDTSIAEGPSNPTALHWANFTFAGTDAMTPPELLTFQCRLDSQNATDFSACTSPRAYSGLTAGTHTFEVRAVDLEGNVDPSPAVHAWTITPPGVAPETIIDAGPDPRTVNPTATFTFSSNEPGSTFTCAIDGGAFTPCTSPQSYEVAVGSHAFAVAATDLEGLTDQTPAVYAWIVGPPAVPTQVSCGQVLAQSTLVLNDLVDCQGDGLVIGAHAITVDLNGHLIDGIEQGAGIRNPGFDHVTITDGTIAGGTRDDAPAPDAASGIRQFEHGVFVSGGSLNPIVSALNVASNKLTGIRLSDADGATVRGNALYGNEVGIAVLDGTENALVRRNVLAQALKIAIHVVNSQATHLDANAITGSLDASIVLEFAHQTVATGNMVSASPAAIAAQILNSSHDSRFIGNALNGNKGGVEIYGSNGIALTGNVIEQNLDRGISLELSNNSLVRGNQVTGNVGGIWVKDASNNRIESNSINQSSGDGISVEGNSWGNVILSNTANDSIGDGITIASSATSGSGTVIDHNTASGNTGDGIQVSAVVHTITSNVADSNGGWGIYATQGNIDGGGNRASGNNEPAQCFTVVCESGAVPGQPDTVIVERPANPSSSRYATFTFTGTDNADAPWQLEFECRLDSADPLSWAECDNPVIPSNLAAGAHTFEVRALDTQGLIDPTPASYTWMVEAPPAGVAPDTAIVSGPASGTPHFEAIFLFSANEPDVVFECAIDGGPFVPCGIVEPGMPPSATGGYEAEFLETQVGLHRFEVRAIDLEGNVDPTPAVHEWTIAGLIAVVTSGPAFIPPPDVGEVASGGETESTTATFAFTANMAGATFSCSLDLQPFTACMSPLTYSGLAPGEHLFQVSATGPDGSEQLEPTQYEWEIVMAADTTPPDTILTIVPASNSSDVLFGFTGTDNYTPASRLQFECRLDSTLNTAYFSCVSPFNLHDQFPLLAPGQHTFQVRAIDEGLGGTEPNPGNENVDPTPASYTWTYAADTTPPDTAIVIAPPATTMESTVEFTFTGNDGNATPPTEMRFECALDGAAFEPCSSPYSVTTPELGPHTLQIRAIDLALNVDPTPASHTWTLQGPPVVTIDAAPASTAGSTATFAFSADQAGATFACSLDVGPYVGCTSPLTYTSLPAGPHIFAVRAANAAGVTGEPASHEWLVEGVDVTAPDTVVATGPALTTVLTFATFTITATELNSSFQCSLDGAAFGPCSPSVDYVGLSGGSHTFLAYAVDGSGNADPTPASYTWSILGTGPAPETTIELGPLDLGPTQMGAFENTTATTATFVFSSSNAGSTFECIIGLRDPMTQDAVYGPWTPCTSPHTYSGLPAGLHEFQVRATNSAGVTDPSPADYDWEIVEPQLAAPRTSLDNGPAAITELTDAVFEFSAFDAVTGEPEPLATFECALDGAAYAECFSPVSYTNLAIGTHTFAVRATDAEGHVDATPEAYTWTIDAPAGPPDTQILSGPPAVTASQSVTFTFTTTNPDATFECALGGEGFTPCGSPVLSPSDATLYFSEELGGLLAGPHTLQVRAVHDTLGADLTPAAYSWTTDPAEQVAPNTTIVSSPAALTVSAAAIFEFTSDEPQVTFECTLDGTTPTSCTSPYEYAALSEGTHTFQVRAIDIVQNADPTPAAFTWTIIAAADQLNTTITTGPATTTASASATFTFTASVPGSTFECALDGAGFEACVSPLTFDALSDGFHTFQVVATDPLGNEDPTPAAYTWTVQTQQVGAPFLDTSIVSGPTLTTVSTSATFAFTSANGTSLECAIDGAAFAPCISPVSYAGLTLGTHIFDVRALDASGAVDPTPARHGWTVLADTTLLDTQILSGPALTTVSTSAMFNVSSNQGASFECALDGAAFAACVPPVGYTNLAIGAHLFGVRAVDASGAADLTPATYTWTVEPDGIPLTTTLHSGPAAVTASADATFVFSAVEPDVTFECAVDGAAFEACASPVTVNDLLEGAHQFQVRAVDASLNAGPTASYVWTVQLDTTGPTTTLLSGPAALTGSPDAMFTFTAGDPLAVFECSLDGQPFEPCSVPEVYGDLLAGEHTFQVRAVNEALVAGAPVSYTWTVVSEPDTTILVAPASPSGADAATFVFTSDQPATFQCSLNGGPLAPCASPFEARGLVDGAQEFEVLATNTYGIADATPAVHQWTVQLPPDVTPPETTIVAGPSGVNASVTVLFEFAGSDARTPALELEFECSLDGAPFESCSSPATLDLVSAVTGLELPGEHTFAVRAIDAALNADPTPATRTWTYLDITAPETTILSGPPSETDAASATFTFAVSVPEPGITFECSLDGAVFAACTSPYTVTSLAQGNHLFQVRAIDAAGNVESVLETYEWIVNQTLDTVPPETAIVGGPSSPTAATDATFSLLADEPNVTFECRLDAGAFSACTTPFEIQGVASGEHTLQVRAVDAGGNSDATPASYTWTVTAPPDTTILSGPANPSGAALATFTFSSPEPSATFQCTLDGDGPVPCTSPHAALGLIEGPHHFEVRAVVTLGVTADGLPATAIDPTPAVFDWEVGLSPDTSVVSVTPLPVEPGATPVLQFIFTGTDDLTPVLELDYECALDGGAFEGCDTPYELETIGLAEGTHTLLVRAVDSAMHVDSTPATFVFETGGVPDTSIVSGPAPQSDATDATFTFASTQPGVTYECSLDAVLPFAPCTSPVMFTNLAYGEHELEVRAVNASGVVDPEPATFTWQTGDLTPPTVTLTSSPALSTEETTATFSFTVDDPGAQLLCSLDGGLPQFCTSPRTYTGLMPGDHTFEVEATKPTLLVEGVPATYDWTIGDVQPPDTVVLPGPAALTTDTAASFTLTGTDNAPVIDLAFECSLDAAAFAACDSPLELTAVVLGEHTLLVRAIDAALNVDPTPASYSWTVDQVPETAIEAGPTATTEHADATFVFSGVDNNPASLAFQCALDGGVFNACSSPHQLTGLAAGDHTFAVRAVDQAGFVDATPATYTWSVTPPADTTAPDTTITSAPSGTTIVAEATVMFASNEATSTFECALDGGAFAACSSPATLAGLAGGAHTFAVRAVDAAGNADASPATAGWTISVAPETTILSGPLDPVNTTNATFTFTSNQAGATFSCALDLQPFAPCTSPVSYTGLSAGLHELRVQATNADGLVDATPDDYEWTIDLTVPTTGITSQPAGSTTSTGASFTVTSNDPAATFECALDAAGFAACPATVNYTGLGAGAHTFSVRAVDAAGNVDATPAVYTWTVTPADTTAPDTTIDTAPAATSTSSAATFSFSASEPGAAFQCALDGGAFAACTSPRQYTGLTLGSHTFVVRAADAAGNVDQTPASLAWTIASSSAGCGAPVTLTATRDSWIDQGSASNNFGSDSILKVQSKSTNLNFRALLGFTLPALPAGCSVQSATLRLYSPSATSSRTLQALRITGTWSESSVTWSNQPATTGTAATTTSGTGFREWNVASHVEAMYQAGPSNGFLVRDAAENSGSYEQQFHSREKGETPPQLVLAFASSGATSDTTPPDTSITAAPPSSTPATSASFSFSATETGSAFQCAIDGGAFAACSSPAVYSGLSLTTHTFAVRAVDSAGNVDAAPATRTWTITTPVSCGAPVTLAANADAWIDQNSSSANKGTDSILKVQSKSSSNNHRALVRFAMPAAPSGCVVQSATLRVYSSSAVVGRTLQALRITAAWSEGSVTWSNQPATTGTAATTASGTGYREWSVGSQVQAMYTAGVFNGFLIRDAVENSGSYEQQFHSREKGESPPQLVITFGPQ